MANEITVSASLRVKKGTYPPEFSRSIPTRTFDQTGTNQSQGVASIGTVSHEAIPIADIGTPGYAWFQNTDPTNFVQIGADSTGTFVPFVKLKPGRFAVFPLAVAPYAKADTAACDLEYGVLED